MSWRRVVFTTATVGLTVGLAACGGSSSDTASKKDRAIIADVVAGAASVVQAATPVMTCDATTCPRPALERLRLKADEVSARLSHEAKGVSNECARDGLRSYIKAVGELGAYAVAYEGHQEQRGSAALDIADRSRGEAIARWTSCGLMKPGQSIGIAFSEAYDRIGRAITGIDACRARSCLIRIGRALDRAATASLPDLRGVVARATNPPCLHQMGLVGLRYVETAAQLGKAAERVEVQQLQALGRRYSNVQAQLAGKARTCASVLKQSSHRPPSRRSAKRNPANTSSWTPGAVSA